MIKKNKIYTCEGKPLRLNVHLCVVGISELQISHLADLSFPENCWMLAAIHLKEKGPHLLVLSSMVLRAFSMITDSNSFAIVIRGVDTVAIAPFFL